MGSIRSLRSATTTGGSLRGRRVIVAEDDASARRVIAAALRDMGLDVVEIGDGGTMLAAIAGHYKNGRKPEDLDLIVTDVHMPVLDGLEVFRGLRAAHWTTPTIVVTADDTPEIRRAAARLGATLLTKPLDLDVLEATVRALLVPLAIPSQPSSSPAL